MFWVPTVCIDLDSPMALTLTHSQYKTFKQCSKPCGFEGRGDYINWDLYQPANMIERHGFLNTFFFWTLDTTALRPPWISTRGFARSAIARWCRPRSRRSSVLNTQMTGSRFCSKQGEQRRSPCPMAASSLSKIGWREPRRTRRGRLPSWRTWSNLPLSYLAAHS